MLSCRHAESSLTRPQRAIARQLYREQTHTNKEIADYLKCDTRDIYTAINNETNDNLNEDEHYYNEARDFIDVDLYHDASDSLQAEESELMEVDQKLVVDLNDISDFEMEENDSCMYLCQLVTCSVDDRSRRWCTSSTRTAAAYFSILETSKSPKNKALAKGTGQCTYSCTPTLT